MQSTIHNPSQLNQFEAHFRGVTDAVESESIPEVACCRTLVQRSYSTHSVVIPENPVLIADADAQGAWVTAMVFVPNMALQQTKPLMSELGCNINTRCLLSYKTSTV
ncbi:hypothetical protein BML2537_35770 [Providencia stuartii]|nr:hypothetical protein BML2537_35770 [Providencia stuartii]CAK6602694.1 hypothetical protein PSTU1396_03375 [Providencia stuartii]CAK6607300.1 hypothetical protein PS9952019_03370 [Providencia stuartii]